MKKEIPNNGSSDGELGEGWNFVRVPVIVKDGTVVLGCHTTPGLWTGTWFSADDFGLTQYPYSDEYLEIEEVEADNIKVFIVNGYIYV